MKKILTVCLLCCLLFVGTFTLVGCNNSNEHKDMNLSISNYENYTSLSVGQINETYTMQNSNSLSISMMSNKKNKKTYLLGKDKDGSFKKIDFNENNQFIERYNVVAVKDIGNFLILLYSQNFVDNVATEITGYGFDDYFFALYKPTGKLFDITKYHINVFTMGVYSAYGNSFFSISYKNNDEIIYQFSVENNILKIEERFNMSLVSDFGVTFITDKYGNIFSTHNGATNISRYIITANGKIQKLNENVNIAVNGVAYTNNAYFDENGNLIETEQIPSLINPYYINKSFVGNKFLIYSNNNVSYFRQISNSSSDRPGEIIKCEFNSDNSYTITTIEMQKYEKDNGVIIKDRIYFLNGSEIYYVNIIDGTYNSISSDYIFNKMYTDNQDSIIFEAINENMDIVIGNISYDGNISVGIQEKEYSVEYVFPLF